MKMALFHSMSRCRRTQSLPLRSSLSLRRQTRRDQATLVTKLHALSDEALLERFQRAAFDYFLQDANPDNGLVADTTRENAPVSIAVVGFALSSYLVAVERGW